MLPLCQSFAASHGNYRLFGDLTVFSLQQYHMVESYMSINNYVQFSPPLSNMPSRLPTLTR